MCATANISEYQIVNKFVTGALLKTFVLNETRNFWTSRAPFLYDMYVYVYYFEIFQKLSL